MLLKPLSALLFLLASTTTASHLAAGYQQCGGNILPLIHSLNIYTNPST